MTDLLKVLRPEEQLLLKLCRLEFTEEQKMEIRELMKSVTDWEYFVRMSNEHGIIALCWFNILESGNREFIPEEILESLHLGYLKNLARNTKIYNLLDEVLELAGKEGIKVLLLKGLVLEKTVYGNKGLRQMNDLDILVKKEDAMNLRKILLQNGFSSEPFMSKLHERILPNIGKHLPEMYKSGISIEIHYNLQCINDISLARSIYENPVSIKNENRYYDCPEIKLHLIYLFNHLYKHETEGVSQLRLYADIANTLLLLNERELLQDKRLSNYIEANIFTKEILFVLEQVFGIRISFFSGFSFKLNEKSILDKFMSFIRKPKQIKLDHSRMRLKIPLNELDSKKNKFLFIFGYLLPSKSYMKYHYRDYSFAGTLINYPKRWIRLIRVIITGN